MLMMALDEFCMHAKFSVDSFKTKIILVKSQIKDKPCIIYNNEPFEIVGSFKYHVLDLEVLSNHRWNVFVTRCLYEGKRA